MNNISVTFFFLFCFFLFSFSFLSGFDQVDSCMVTCASRNTNACVRAYMCVYVCIYIYIYTYIICLSFLVPLFGPPMEDNVSEMRW